VDHARGAGSDVIDAELPPLSGSFSALITHQCRPGACAPGADVPRMINAD
jgi:hypothetical protein